MGKSSFNNSAVLVGIFFCIMAGFFWGTTGVARALGPKAASLAVVGARVSVAAVVLFIISLVAGDFKRAGALKGWPWPEIVSAGFFLGFFTYIYLESMDKAGVALGAAVSCASIPVFSLIFEMLVMKIRPSLGQFIGLVGCAVGGTMVSWFSSGGDTGSAVFLGVMLAILSGVIFSGYSMAIQRAVRRGCPYNVAITGMFVVATCIWLPYALLAKDMTWLKPTTEAASWVANHKGLLMALYLGVCSGAGGYFCYVRGIAKVPVSIAVSLGLAEPLTGTLLGVFLLEETLSGMTWAGMAILFVGIFIIGQATVAKTQREARLATATATA